ncbi:MAG TPA: polysaccharide biosynthesis/export family protein [Acidobacteriaceae bacterium]|nr:polysaccharide biosynthesis/export family protein [Acidobacteriaceae bacterium]
MILSLRGRSSASKSPTRHGRISSNGFAAGLLFMAIAGASFAQTTGTSTGVPSGQVGQGTFSLPPAQAGQAVTGQGAGTAAPSPADAVLYPAEDFRLGPGDLISVRLFLVSDYAATVRLDQNGDALLPLIGSVPLRGLSVREAQLLIAQRLREGQFYREPDVIIQVLQTVNGTARITGEMHAEVPVTVQRSLREVLLIAGGLPATASHTIKIVRRGVKEPIVVNLGTDLASSTAADVPVLPNDLIQITRASVVYVIGAFARQGAVPLDQATPLTLMQCASLSGGINFEGKYQDLRIIRTYGNERKFVDVDIKKIREGKAPDPVLQANDIVYLPTNNMKAVTKSLGVGGVIGFLSLLITLRNY